jgi:hypothetical protein
VRSVRDAQGQGEALPVHVIDGMPGVGKTAFAVHAGHLMADRFPDRQLFVNLNRHTTGRSPVQTRDAFASLLTAAGVPTGQVPVGDDGATVVGQGTRDSARRDPLGVPLSSLLGGIAVRPKSILLISMVVTPSSAATVSRGSPLAHRARKTLVRI